MYYGEWTGVEWSEDSEERRGFLSPLLPTSLFCFYPFSLPSTSTSTSTSTEDSYIASQQSFC